MFIETRQIFHWRRVFHKGRDFSYCKRLIAGVMMFTASAVNVEAKPEGGFVRPGGDATVTIGTHTLIEQRSNRVDIDWTSFDTKVTGSVRESVTFDQPGSHSLAVNHIGGNRTQFDGDLISNGRVFLINQNGITFGESAQVNVGSLLATTSKLDSMVDQPSHDFNGEGYGSIINEGAITVSDGGFAILAAPYVENSGFIKADLGQVWLASTNKFTINVDLRGDGLITFSPPPEFLDDMSPDIGAKSSGTLQSRSGHVYLTANMVNKVVEGVVNLSGVVDADEFVSAPNGDLMMVASVDAQRYFPGSIIKVDSVGDINIGMDGSADIHAVHAVSDEFDLRRPTTFNAEATFHAEGNISVGGAGNPVTITLKANSPAGGPVLIPLNSTTNGASSTADAEARLEMIAATRGGKGKLTIANTAIEVTAEASDTGGIIMLPSGLGTSDISNGDGGDISAVATVILEGAEVEINADINVHASADATGMVDGPVANSADAIGMEYDEPYMVYGPRPADALAVFDVFANGDIERDTSGNMSGYGERGDLTLVGDITVSAISKTVNSMNSKATANTMLVASGSTEVTGEINVDATATSESEFGFVVGETSSVAVNTVEYIEGESNSADANAALVLLGGTPPGLIPLLREISLNYIDIEPLDRPLFESLGTLSDILTLANLDDVLGFFEIIDPENFFGGGIGPGSVSYTGDSNINALADFNSIGFIESRTEGKAEATSAAYYVAGGDVFINTDPIKVDSQAYADYEAGDTFLDKATTNDIIEGSYVDTEARSFLVAAAGLDEYFNDGSENESHSEITVLGALSTRAQEQATLNGEPNPGEYNQLAAAVTALVATGDITVKGADPLAEAAPAVAQGRTSRWQVCYQDVCDPVEEGVDGLMYLAERSADDWDENESAHLAQLVIESLYGDIDIQPKDTDDDDDQPISNDVQPTGLFTDPIGPNWPGDLPLRFDANGRMLVATGTDATKPPQIVALDSNIENALLSGGDPSVLLPPTAAGGCLAAGRDAFTISNPGYFERMISASCETEE